MKKVPLFTNWFHGRTKKGPATWRSPPLAEIEHMINHATWEVFRTFHESLLRMPSTYIVPAVWGEDTGKEALDETQAAIHRILTPVLDRMIGMFEKRSLEDRDRLSLEYLIRGLLVHRILYMVEYYRYRAFASAGPEENQACGLRLEKIDHFWNA